MSRLFSGFGSSPSASEPPRHRVLGATDYAVVRGYHGNFRTACAPGSPAPTGTDDMGALGMKKREIVKVSGSVPGFSAPYQYVFSAYFDSAADLQRCMTDPKMGQVLADVPNYFTGETDVLVGETVG